MGRQMGVLARLAVAFFLAAGQLTAACAQDNATTVVSQGLVPFASDEGLARLSRSDARVNFPALANQFEGEYNGAFCGPTSAAIVLNALVMSLTVASESTAQCETSSERAPA